MKLWIGVLGILTPFLISVWTLLEARFHSERPQLSSNNFSSHSSVPQNPPYWFWILFVFLLLFTRFYRLTYIPYWPMTDEGAFSSLALNFLNTGDWKLLWGEFKVEPFLIWSLGGFFNVKEPSLLALRLYPALISIGVSLLAYWAVRRFFSGFITAVFSWLLGFCFWNFTYARLCTPNDWILFFQFLCLGFLGLFLDAEAKTQKWIWLFCLSCSAGLGFYTHTNWPVVWFFILILLGSLIWRSGRGERNYLWVFGFLTACSVIPLLFARLSTGGMNKIHGEFTGLFQLKPYFIYLAGIFWNGTESFPVGPIRGGMLNPFLGAWVLVGLLRMLEKSGKSLILIMGFGVFISLLPGTVTPGLELHRVTPLFPFLVLIGAFGVENLASTLKFSPWLAVVPLLLVSMAWDSYHFTGPYCDIRLAPKDRQWRTVFFYRAYQTLKQRSGETGPLYIFSEFNLDYDDKTLNVPCYPFDALQNRNLSGSVPKYTALLVNSHFGPFLKARFPEMEWVPLDDPQTSKRLGLFLIRTSQIPVEELKEWREADLIHRKINNQIMDKNAATPWSFYAQELLSLKPVPLEDKFLSSVYWGKIAFFYFMSRDYPRAVLGYEKAIREGYPSRHHYFDLALSLKLCGRNAESEAALKKADVEIPSSARTSAP